MKASRLLLFVTLVFLLLGVPTGAQAIDVHAKIGDTQKDGPSPLDISGTYSMAGVGTITIAPTDASETARVEAPLADSQYDHITLRNAKITAESDFTDVNNPFVITFWGTFANEPHTDAASTPVRDVTYEVTLTTASLRRGNVGATGDNVKLKGLIEFPENSGYWNQITDAVLAKTMTQLSYSFFSNPPKLTELWGHSPELTGPRVLKAELKLTMRKNTLPTPADVLTIAKTNGIIVRDTAAAEESSEVGCDCPTNRWLRPIIIILVVVILVVVWWCVFRRRAASA